MIFNNFANKVLNLATAKATEISGTGKCYLALSTSAPNADGSNINEPGSASYERILLNINEVQEHISVWGNAASGVISNTKEFTSRENTEEEPWPECSHFVIYDAKVNGNPIAAGALRDPDGEIDEATGLYPEKCLTVEPGKIAVFRAGALQLTLQ